ncbi:MAG: tRNA 2-thiouridine(34) synthase MnmA [Propionibacteriaceae bacterium]|jgi:tRNA-specific 2-thiouridylase|nr:tRNA 2-thiouridine(34) synthase MnmA [Propionibacteriaceae bacterium]
MSGGVDSSVAAARLVEAGHDVTGMYMQLSNAESSYSYGIPDDPRDAQRVASILGIPFLVWDFAAEYEKSVVDYFQEEYAAGRTPNPCLRCNRTIKFGKTLQTALDSGFDAFATGHYVRTDVVDGKTRLLRSHNLPKDQSYVLGVLNQHQLSHAVFPLGDETEKSAVRAEAERRGLPVAEKKDSYDICFIRTGTAASFLKERLGVKPGDIVDEEGEVLGHHDGAFQYTVGQRKGLALGKPAKDGKPRFVLGIDPVTNSVKVGPRDHLRVQTIRGKSLTFTEERVGEPWEGFAQWRAHSRPVPARFSYPEGKLLVELKEPAEAVASGQFLICYDGERVVGSAVIESAQ